MEKTIDLYYLLLTLPIALKNYGNSKIESGLQKFQPTPEEANPNRRFVENRVIVALEGDKTRRSYVANRGLRWFDYLSFVKKLYADLQTRPYFLNYMENRYNSFTEDLSLLSTFFEMELEDNEELYQILEDISIYWIDDLEYVLGLILRTLSTLKEGAPLEHPQIFKKDEDREYALHLLGHSMLHYDEYLELLRTFAHNWEIDRMATTDICLIVLGISEGVCCPTIPSKVTINEIVELSKYYSTPNSRLFVNGVLDKIVQHLKREGKIVKTGRGLVEN